MDNIEEKILDEILKTTYTADTFKKRFQALRLMLSGKIYSGGKDDEKEDEKETGIGEKNHKKDKSNEEKWLESFDKKFLDGITSDQFSVMSEHIEKYLSSLNPLTIYFVFLPEEKQVEEVGEWLRQSLKNPRLVFTVKVDTGLIGGCAIVYKGIYKDFSIRAKIQARQETLIQEFRRYFKNG